MTDKGQMGKLLTLEELNDRFNLPKGSKFIYNKIHNKTLPIRYLKIGKYLRFPENEVESYLSGNLQSCR